MADFETHCSDCEKELGERFEYVHVWLDELYVVLGPKHRSVRHNVCGVEEVRKRWGDRAARAAEIHIIKDCFGRGVPTMNEAQMWSIFGSGNEPPDDKGTTKIEE